VSLEPPSFRDVLDARLRIRPHLAPTPLRQFPSLNRLLGTETWVKLDNLLPTGSFKVRGGINLVSRLDADERRRGVIAASTGNHGQSVAYAARLFGVSAIICAPLNANPVKLAGMEDLGAEVIRHGADYDEARLHCEQLARAQGYRYIHSGDEPLLIAGVGTHALEILEERPGIDTLIVAIGGGSGAAGAAIVAKVINPHVRVVGVQSAQSPAGYESWRAGALVAAPNRTRAEGLSTGTAFDLPQRILREHLDDFLLLDDGEIEAAIPIAIQATRTLVEAAAASTLAAALKLKDQLAGSRTALIFSGANISPEQLVRAMGQAAATPRMPSPPG
jgi:threonine dehydratase